jgi:hypothetical protein
MRHCILLQRNLIYTGITRARRLLVVVVQKKALALTVMELSGSQAMLGAVEQFEEFTCVTSSFNLATTSDSSLESQVRILDIAKPLSATPCE